MANEIVKYKNKLNDFDLTDFTSQELNLFIAIVSRVRGVKDRKIAITLQELKDLTEFDDYHKSRFNKTVKGIVDKVFKKGLSYISDEGNDDSILLFTKRSIQKEAIVFTVSPEGLDFFNDLTDNFTRFSLHQFASLSSKYSKIMFMLLKQYRTIGIRRIKKSDFYLLLGVPKSYRSNNVDQKIIGPILKELSPIFKNLKINKVKHHNRIVGYKITFTKEDPNKNDFDYSKSADNEWKYFDTDSDIITHYKEHKEIQAKQELAKQKVQDCKDKVKQDELDAKKIAKESSDWVDLETLTN